MSKNYYIRRFNRITICVTTALIMLTGIAQCDEALTWPPILDSESTVTKTRDARKIVRFKHGERQEWGYQNFPELKSLKFLADVPKAEEELGAANKTQNSFVDQIPTRRANHHFIM